MIVEVKSTIEGVLKSEKSTNNFRSVCISKCFYDTISGYDRVHFFDSSMDATLTSENIPSTEPTTPDKSDHPPRSFCRKCAFKIRQIPFLGHLVIAVSSLIMTMTGLANKLAVRPDAFITTFYRTLIIDCG